MKQLTKGSAILDKMVFNFKDPKNREGLGYECKVPLNKDEHELKLTKATSPEPPTLKCTYCNVVEHVSLDCKAKEEEGKGKFNWVPKGSSSKKKETEKKKPKKKVDPKVNAPKKPTFRYR